MCKEELKEIENRNEQSELAKERSREKNRKYIEWQHLTRDQKEVAKRIIENNYEFLQGADWGFLDNFIIFLKEIGFLKVLDISGEGYERKMITIAKLLMTYNMKILRGIAKMGQVPDMLFKDTGLLMLLGFTARQIKNGVCKRSKKRGKKRKGPISKDTLSDVLDRISTEEIEGIINGSVQILNEGGFIDDNIYICDGTDIETTEDCQGCGRKTVKEEHINKITGKKTEIEKTTYGFKLIVIRGVYSGIVVAAKMAKIEESEKDYTLSLIKQAEKNIGKKIGVLLLDRGFIAGTTLWKINKVFEADFVIPATKTMDITKDARGLRNSTGENIWREATNDIEAVGIKGLVSYDQYGDEEHNKKNKHSKDFVANPINVVMVTRWKEVRYKPGEEKVFLTSLRVDNPVKLRSLIENTTFRELKQGWLINSIPKKTEAAARSHAFLTICMFNMSKAYRSKLGKEITEEGIIRFRRTTDLDTRNTTVIISEEHYAIFDLEELAILWGKPPKYFLRVNPQIFRREYKSVLETSSSMEKDEKKEI